MFARLPSPGMQGAAFEVSQAGGSFEPLMSYWPVFTSKPAKMVPLRLLIGASRSYRRPRLTVSLGDTFHWSCTNAPHSENDSVQVCPMYVCPTGMPRRAEARDAPVVPTVLGSCVVELLKA